MEKINRYARQDSNDRQSWYCYGDVLKYYERKWYFKVGLLGGGDSHPDHNKIHNLWGNVFPGTRHFWNIQFSYLHFIRYRYKGQMKSTICFSDSKSPLPEAVYLQERLIVLKATSFPCFYEESTLPQTSFSFIDQMTKSWFCCQIWFDIIIWLMTECWELPSAWGI